MTDDALRVRLRAVCCATWGISPWEFDRAEREGLVAAEDVVECVVLTMATTVLGSAIRPYIQREQHARNIALLRRVELLTLQADGTPDIAAKERIAEEIRRLQHDHGRQQRDPRPQV